MGYRTMRRGCAARAAGRSGVRSPTVGQGADSRDLCAKHYRQAIVERRFGNPECSKDRCKRGATGRGLCDVHLVAERRSEGYQDPPRKHRELSCTECGEAFVGSRGAKLCATCLTAQRAARGVDLATQTAQRAEQRRLTRKIGPHTRIEIRDCESADCSTLFVVRAGRYLRRYCSRDCRYRSNLVGGGKCADCREDLPPKSWARRCPPCRETRQKATRKAVRRVGSKHRVRAKSYGRRYVSGLDWKRLYRENGPDCALCGETTDPEDFTLAPLDDGTTAFMVGSRYPTLDHIVPLARGGHHEPDNVQLACHSCNSQKWATVDPELLAALSV